MMRGRTFVLILFCINSLGSIPVYVTDPPVVMLWLSTLAEFNEFDLEFSSTCDVQQNGSLGDVTVSGRRVQLKTCCKEDVGDWMFPLPNDKPFRLFVRYYCPYVRGTSIWHSLSYVCVLYFHSLLVCYFSAHCSSAKSVHTAHLLFLYPLSICYFHNTVHHYFSTQCSSVIFLPIAHVISLYNEYLLFLCSLFICYFSTSSSSLISPSTVGHYFSQMFICSVSTHCSSVMSLLTVFY